jgi:phage portal protein BeeE
VGLLDRIAARTPPSSVIATKTAAPEVVKYAQPPFWAYDNLLDQAWPSLGGARQQEERLDVNFVQYCQQLYKRNGVVFSAIDRRQQVFSQARFQWQRWTGGRPQDMYGNSELALLEKPWPNGTTGEMMARMEVDGSIAGNSYWTTVDNSGRIGRAARREDGRRMARLRPDWVTLIVGSKSDDPYAIDARIVAFSYLPRPDSGYQGRVIREPVILLPEEVCHYSPKPDPTARFIGMSWLTPIITDIFADDAAATHKMRFFQNGASPSFVVSFDKEVPPRDLDLYKKKFDDMHAGADNAYSTLFMGGGADIRPLTVDLRSLDYKMTTGAGETRMAVASGVPAVILGISEGLSGSSLNEGNFRAAKRMFVDGTIQDLWKKVAPSLEVLLSPPGDGSELTVDPRDIPFLREDSDQQAAIRSQDASTMVALGNAGWEPESIKLFMATSDVSRLVHTGRMSVQLQAPGAGEGVAEGTTEDEKAKAVAEVAAKLFSGVDPFLTPDEARAILNAAGAQLRIPGPEMPKPEPVAPPTAPPTAPEGS